MITPTNYTKQNFSTNNWPAKLADGHKFVTGESSGFKHLELYNDDATIKAAIDKHITDLNEYLAAKPSVSVTKSSKSVTKKPKSVQVKKVAENQVENLPLEIQFMKRFVSMHNKTKEPKHIMNLLDAIQKAIIEKRVQKTSNWASEIDEMQKALIKTYNFTIDNKTKSIRIEVEKNRLERFTSIITKWSSLKSVALIKRYINMDGAGATKPKAEKLKADINKFLENNPQDKYRENLKSILVELEFFFTGGTLTIKEQTLAGLPWMMIAQGAAVGIKKLASATGRATKSAVLATRPYVNKAYTKTKEVTKKAVAAVKQKKSSAKKTKSHAKSKKQSLGAIEDISKEQIIIPAVNQNEPIIAPPTEKINKLQNMFVKGSEANKKPAGETFRLFDDLGKFLGDLEQNELGISIEGDQGSGKTQLAFQLANGFLDLNKEGAMLCYEIPHDSAPMRKYASQYLNQVNREKILYNSDSSQGLEFIKKAAPHLDFIIIDSWPKLKVSPKEFDTIRKQFPHCIFIAVLQRLSSGDIRGGNDALYDAGINIECKKVDNTFVNNYAYTSKNRYGQSGLKYNISQQKLIG